MRVWYASLEDVKTALDSQETVYSNTKLYGSIEAASINIDKKLRRRFYPQVATRYMDWPSRFSGTSYRLWLDANELISATALVSGGVTIASSDYFLRREDDIDEPPYEYIEVDLASGAVFSSSGTHQRQVAVTGLFGYSNEETPAGALAEALDSSETDVDVTNSTAIGIGNLIRVDSERMLVTAKSMLTTAQTVQTPLTAAVNNVAVAVTDGTAYVVGETILLDSERMLIVDIAGNTLTVKRAQEGSALATHTGSTIYAPRRVTVERGALGTTAAVHDTAATIRRWVPPALITEWCIAEALNSFEQKATRYARVIGTGEAQREAPGRGIRDIRQDAIQAYGRCVGPLAV